MPDHVGPHSSIAKHSRSSSIILLHHLHPIYTFADLRPYSVTPGHFRLQRAYLAHRAARSTIVGRPAGA